MKQNSKILVVDDDPNHRKTLAVILRSKAYDTVVAGTGAEAIAAAKPGGISVALIDLMLPDMDGIEVMARIKAINPLTEAIVLTGHASMDTAIEATKQGAYSYLLKPYQMDDLLRNISHGVERHYTQEEILRLASFPRLHPSPVIELDADGEVIYANPAAERVFPDLSAMGTRHPLLNGLTSPIADLRQGGQPGEISHEAELDGAIYELHISRPRDVNLIRLFVTDITERKHAEEELRIAGIAFESQEGIIVTDPKGVIVRVNRAFSRLTGYMPEEAIGRSPALLKSGRHDQAFYQRIWQALGDSGRWQGEIWNRHKSGRIYAEWLTISAVNTPHGDLTHYVGTYSEITRNREAAAEIHRLAYYDSLTHLPNRRLLHDRMGQALVASSRSGHFGALLLLDLDTFKTLNDTRGHDVGDQLLIEVALRIQASVRAHDTVARLGGDEFVVMLEDLSVDVHDAAVQSDLVGEKLRVTLAQPYKLGGHEFHCTASLGVALFHGQEEPVDTVVKHADLAMYNAKSVGGNALRFFDPAMQIALDERSAMEAYLRLAIEGGQLRLHYQAQVDGAGLVIGAEALLRWAHPQRGLLRSADFIPLAEETGLIVPIGRWVLASACAQIKAWSGAYATRELRLAVNVGARQFRQPEFVAQVTQALARSGADPTRLRIELTESIAMDNVVETMTRMEALKALGVGFAIDDFGTGFSSLSCLKRLPLDQLKIDPSFTQNITGNADDAVVVQTIISMGKSLGLDVIAEGVETEAQRQGLVEYGCVAFQGYLFSEPLPLEAFEERLQRHVPFCPAEISSAPAD